MTVKLIDVTANAVDKLIYTKATRLTQGSETRAKIGAMTDEEKMAELAYMAGTIPSSWEFVIYTFEITDVTRAFTHQLVRTRTGSYAQQTMRMLNKEQFTYTLPDRIRLDPGAQQEYEGVMDHIQASYDRLIKMGTPIEDARGVLPTNIHTNIIAQFSLRTLSEMAKSRTGGRTQDEYQKVFRAMASAVIDTHPWAEQFLFPDKWLALNKLEEIIHVLADGQSKEQVIAGLKIIDKFKKEAK